MYNIVYYVRGICLVSGLPRKERKILTEGYEKKGSKLDLL